MTPTLTWLALVILGVIVSVGEAKLVGTYSSLQTMVFTINEIDPAVGAPGRVLYSTKDFIQFFALTPAFDPLHKRMYVSVLGPQAAQLAAQGWLDKDKRVPNNNNIKGMPETPFPSALVGFEFGSNGNATQIANAYLPFGYIFGLQYDPIKGYVYFLGGNLESTGTADQNIHFGYIDPVTGKNMNLTVLPPNIFPSMAGIGGAATIFDASRRAFVVATKDKSGNNYYLTSINVDTLRITHTPITDSNVVAIIQDQATKTVYALLSPAHTIGNLTWATVNLSSGALKPILKWNQSDLVFVVGSLAALDSQAKTFYSVLGNGFSTHVALVSVAINSGKITNIAYVPPNQPQSLLAYD